MLKKALFIGAVMGAVSTHAAADMYNYIGISAGQAKAERPSLLTDSRTFINHWEAELGMGSANSVITRADGRISSDGKDSAYKLVFGLQINPYLAVEAQYADFGDSSVDQHSGASWLTAAGMFSPIYTDADMEESYKLKTSGPGINLVGNIPVHDRVTLIGKVGYHYLRTKIQQSITTSLVRGELIGGVKNERVSSTAEGGKNVTVREWVPSLGVGVDFLLHHDLSIALEYERYFGVGDGPLENGHGDRGSFKHDLDFLSLGLRYSF